MKHALIAIAVVCAGWWFPAHHGPTQQTHRHPSVYHRHADTGRPMLNRKPPANCAWYGCHKSPVPKCPPGMVCTASKVH